MQIYIVTIRSWDKKKSNKEKMNLITKKTF